MQAVVTVLCQDALDGRGRSAARLTNSPLLRLRGWPRSASGRRSSRKRAARVVGQKPGVSPLHLDLPVLCRCRVVIGQADQGQDHEDARRSCYDVTQELVPHALDNARLRSEVAATPPSVARTGVVPARAAGAAPMATEDD